MKTSRPLLALLPAIAFLVCLNGGLIGNSGGAFPGFSGAPGEGTCVACHSDFALDAGVAAGIATFDLDAPDTVLDVDFSVGGAPVAIDFPSTTRSQHGFSVTSRDGDEAASFGSTSGDMAVLDARNTQNRFGDPSTLTHTRSGNSLTSWASDWVPNGPRPAGPVTFYAAGNAANMSFGTDGDYVFSDSEKMFQARVSSPSSSWPVGTTQPLFLEAPTRPFDAYILVASADPTPTLLAPGTRFEIDLNPFDAIATFSLQTPSIFQNFIGIVDGNGDAQANVILPNAPVLSGATFHFAFATLAVGNVSEVSNTLSVTLQ